MRRVRPLPSPGRRGRDAQGQAALELVACVPLVLAAGLLAWQLVAVLWAGVRAEEAARRAALVAAGGRGGVVTVQRVVPVPGPLARSVTVTVHARVLAP